MDEELIKQVAAITAATEAEYAAALRSEQISHMVMRTVDILDSHLRHDVTDLPASKRARIGLLAARVLRHLLEQEL